MIAAGLLVVLLFLLILPSFVDVSVDYGEDGLRVGVRALRGLVGRCLRLAGPPREGVGIGRLRAALTEFRRFEGPLLYLAGKTMVTRLDVDVTVGLGSADLTAWSAGGIWALVGVVRALVNRLVAAGSAQPRIRMSPRFDEWRFALTLRGGARVRVWHLLAAGRRAWPIWRRTRKPAEKLHKMLVPGHNKSVVPGHSKTSPP